MNCRKTIWGFGVVLLGVAACAPTVRELGDEPLAPGGRAGSAGSGGSQTGVAGSALPSGGGTTSVPTSGGEPSSGGAPEPRECFTPLERLDLARDPNGLGCMCDTAEQYCVRHESNAEPWSGLFDCASGQWQVATSPCDADCFSPTHRPYLAAEPGATGCACENRGPECVLTEHDGRPWRVALYCNEGRWVSAEDGVCGDGSQADCRSRGVTYPHGARRIPSPVDCNECDCEDGKLTCTEGGCGGAPHECPEGSTLRVTCIECSVGAAMSTCSVFETACLTEEQCPDGACGVVCY
ncbi:MAG: sspo [Polyangiaceae bacterium]|jgi:hypothetical protein|nr:sspo [Polyangiaceae bacterium]